MSAVPPVPVSSVVSFVASEAEAKSILVSCVDELATELEPLAIAGFPLFDGSTIYLATICKCLFLNSVNAAVAP